MKKPCKLEQQLDAAEKRRLKLRYEWSHAHSEGAKALELFAAQARFTGDAKTADRLTEQAVLLRQFGCYKRP